MLQALIQDTLSIFYPQLCAACNDLLLRGEDIICTKCNVQLPYSNYHLDNENPVAKQFWGKVQVESASAFLHFHKGERVQRLMHQLKYSNRPDVGIYLGKINGQIFKASPLFSKVEYVIPIPLHKKKERIRGYNQAACFSEGLASGMEIKSLPNGIKRIKHTDTQTKKNRFDRYTNVSEVFAIADSKALRGKHILLVDDVITTGSTLYACAKVLLDVKDVKVYIAAIAFAEL